MALNIFLTFHTTYLCGVVHIDNYKIKISILENFEHAYLRQYPISSQDLILYLKINKHIISLVCKLAYP